ncbi:15090_t:CDS:1 [Racocetra fulgida]|uniref:15090_t:CDS:1 n=1 Tax=Racocetra fulgida TaxID=60492 RepID=A0A9N8ZXY8_9GLOM|nr:15090_t:CDS:1 [Racocetra fulgida]
MLEGADFLGIWLAAEEFMLDDLGRQVRDLFEKKSERLRPNFIQIFKLVYQNETLERFRTHCVDIINTTTWLQDASMLESLDESIFYSLFNDEDHFVHDGIIWKILIQWACAQTPKLDASRLDQWSEADFETLKLRIGHFIPYIRFSLISRNDFYDNVLPYKSILPIDTTSNTALTFYSYLFDENGLNPLSILEDSKVVNHTHIAMIARWIDAGREGNFGSSTADSIRSFDASSNYTLDETSSIEEQESNTDSKNTKSDEKGAKIWKIRRILSFRKGKRSHNSDMRKNNSNKQNTHSDKNVPNKENNAHSAQTASSPILYPSTSSTYKFKLIYRGSRDGFDSSTYNSKCRGKGPTVVVASLSHHRFIIGGYYPISTEGTYPCSVFTGAVDSFIFSFGEGDNLEEESTISRILKEHAHEAIRQTVYGPGFGESDLIIKLAGTNNAKNGVCKQKCYERKIIDVIDFAFDECEVFQVIKEEFKNNM